MRARSAVVCVEHRPLPPCVQSVVVPSLTTSISILQTSSRRAHV